MHGNRGQRPLADPLAAAHAEIAPDEAELGRLGIRLVTNAPQLPGESARDALARRLVETADKEVWNGSTLVGPSWKGIWGSERKFTDGSTGKVDENYIAESINNPAGKIVEGFTPAMPTYQGQLNDDQIHGIVEYIKSLK